MFGLLTGWIIAGWWETALVVQAAVDPVIFHTDQEEGRDGGITKSKVSLKTLLLE